LRASISLVVIGFVLTGLISMAAAQYLPPQPPPVGYPQPPNYPASPSPLDQGTHPYPDALPSADPDDQPYSPQPQPMIGDEQRQQPLSGIRSEPLPPPAMSPQDHGTAVAALLGPKPLQILARAGVQLRVSARSVFRQHGAESRAGIDR